MATSTKKTSKKAVEPIEEEAVEADGFDRVLNRDTVQPNWKAFSAFVEEHGGPKINPKHVGIVLTGYKQFQKSDAAVASREEAAAAKEAEREDAQAASADKREEAAARREAAAEAKAGRDAVKAEKAAAAKKSAAVASKPKRTTKVAKPTPTATAGKVKTAKKKSSATKAAF